MDYQDYTKPPKNFKSYSKRDTDLKTLKRELDNIQFVYPYVDLDAKKLISRLKMLSAAGIDVREEISAVNSMLSKIKKEIKELETTYAKEVAAAQEKKKK